MPSTKYLSTPPRAVGLALTAAAALALSSAPASAQITLGFEGDVGPDPGFVTSHQGFDFGGDRQESSWVRRGSFGAFLPASGSFLAWSNGGTTLRFGRASAFDFFSVWLGAANGSCDRAPIDQRVRGFAGGAEIYTQTVSVACGAPLGQFAFNFTGVDMVQFDGEGDQADVVNLVVDDILVGDHAAVPEPATLLLVGSGLLGLAVLRRRRGELRPT